MLLRRVAYLLAVPVLGVCLISRHSNAQEVTYYTYSTNATDLPSCRSFTSVHRAAWSKRNPKKDNLNASYPVVADIDARSPAGVAGLANGDSIVTINGRTTLGTTDSELGLWKLEVGDRNVVVIKRGDQRLEISFPMGQWVPVPGATLMRDAATGEPKPPARLCRAAQ